MTVEPRDERLELEIECAQAKSRMRESWETISMLRKYLLRFESDYMNWYRRHQKVDMKLAMLDGRFKKLKMKEPRHPEVILTPEQAARMLELLKGIKEGEDNEKE